MNELANCANCHHVFVKSVRSICGDCYLAEEKAFETVYQFLTQRKNREATKVKEDLIIKFIKENRLRTSQFPKLAYPCEKCKNHIVSGKLCHTCSEKLIHDLKRYEDIEAHRQKAKEKQEKQANIYYTFDQLGK